MESPSKLSRSRTSSEGLKKSPLKPFRSDSILNPPDSVEQQQTLPAEAYQSPSAALDRQTSNVEEDVNDEEPDDDDDNDLDNYEEDEVDANDSEVLGAILTDNAKIHELQPSRREKIKNRLRNIKNNVVNLKKERRNLLNETTSGQVNPTPRGSIQHSEKYSKKNTVGIEFILTILQL